MNKKGFTLAELMGVIIILSIILLLTLPAVDKIIKNSKERAYQEQVTSISKAASDWALSNSSLLPDEDGNSITIYLSELKLSGSIAIDIKNPKTGNLLSNNTYVVITKKNNIYEYSVTTIDISDGSNADNAPILVISGDVVDYVEVTQDGSTYKVPSAVAKSSSGVELSSASISTQILKDGNVVSKVDMSTLGTYIIKYSVTDNGVTGNYQKTVVVRDTTNPVITIDSSIVVTATNVSTIVPMNGVSVTDNSGSATTKTTSTVSNIPGSYYITYMATDASGNTTTKRRSVTVTSD